MAESKQPRDPQQLELATLKRKANDEASRAPRDDHVERARREATERLALALRAAHMGTWEWDIPQDNVRWSRETEQIFGIPDGSFAGSYAAYLSFAALEDRETIHRTVQHCLKAAEDGAEIRYEHRILRGDGAAGWIEVRGTLFCDRDGQAARMVGVCMDLTDRKLAEDALRRERDAAQRYLDIVGVILVVLDEHGRIGLINRRGCEILGATEDELIGAPWFERFVPARLRADVTRVFGELMAGRMEPAEYFENSIVTHNGDERLIAWHNTILRDPDGRITGTLSSGEDITDRRRFEEALQSRVVALTQPLDDQATIQFADLFDIDEIQKIQDAFAEATGVASIITNPDGTPITRPSRFCRLCNDIIRNTDKGRCNCFYSDAVIGRYDPRGPTVQPCLSGGLWDAGASITVGGRHVANWLIGQVKNEAQDTARLLRYAEEIGADPDEFRRALEDVPVMSEAQFRKVADTLFLLANELSTKAYQNVQQARFIADRQRAEGKFHKVMSLLRAVIDQAPFGIQVCEGKPAEWELTMLNREAERLLGTDGQPHQGLGWAHGQLKHPERLTWKTLRADGSACPFDQSPLALAMAEGRVTRNLELRIRNTRGTERAVLCNAAPIYGDEQVIIGGVVTYTDITERKHLEAQLLHSQKLEAVGLLAGGVAHDFNNILTAVLGNVDLALGQLRAATVPPVVLAGLEQIEKGALRAAGLTRQLLAFSRRQIAQPQVLDINHMLHELHLMLERLLAENIRLDVVCASHVAPIRMDPGQLEQVVMNLVINARDAMSTGGTLLIEARNVVLDEHYVTTHADARSGPHVLLAISDTGCGMSAETLAHVFEPFFTTKGPGEGTGLGLATVYGIVKQAGGHIHVYSEVGRGTTFKVYLPQCHETNSSAPREAIDASGVAATETILLAEDDEAVRELSTQILQSAGYHVLTAANAAEARAIDAEHRGPLHLLLTDVIMPDTDGRTLAQTLRQRRPNLRVLYVSGYTANVIAHHGVLDDGVELLEKPFNREALLRRVRAVLQQPANETDSG